RPTVSAGPAATGASARLPSRSPIQLRLPRNAFFWPRRRPLPHKRGKGPGSSIRCHFACSAAPPPQRRLIRRRNTVLGRTASSLFWMSRYVERSENMARLVDVGYRISLLPGVGNSSHRGDWASTLVSAGCDGGFFQRYDEISDR